MDSFINFAGIFFLAKGLKKEITDYLLYIIIGFIAITTIPLVFTFIKNKVVKSSDEEKTNIEQ